MALEIIRYDRTQDTADIVVDGDVEYVDTRSLSIPEIRDGRGDYYEARRDKAFRSSRLTRDKHLIEMVRRLGYRNSALGAVTKLEKGGNVPGYLDLPQARSKVDKYHEEAEWRAIRACGSCALQEFCSLEPADILKAAGESSQVRSDYRKQIKGANLGLCEEIIA